MSEKNLFKCLHGINKQRFFEWEMICIFMFTNNNGSFVQGIFICMLFEPLDITLYICIYAYMNLDENIYFLKKTTINRMNFLFLVSFTHSRWRGMKFVTDVITVEQKNEWKIKTNNREHLNDNNRRIYYFICISHWHSFESHERTQTHRNPSLTEIITMKCLCKFLSIPYSIWSD